MQDLSSPSRDWMGLCSGSSWVLTTGGMSEVLLGLVLLWWTPLHCLEYSLYWNHPMISVSKDSQSKVPHRRHAGRLHVPSGISRAPQCLDRRPGLACCHSPLQGRRETVPWRTCGNSAERTCQNLCSLWGHGFCLRSPGQSPTLHRGSPVSFCLPRGDHALSQPSRRSTKGTWQRSYPAVQGITGVPLPADGWGGSAGCWDGIKSWVWHKTQRGLPLRNTANYSNPPPRLT